MPLPTSHSTHTGLGTFTSYHFLRHYRDAMPPAVMASMHLLACCLIVATVLQWFWGWQIVHGVKRKLSSEAKTKAR